MKLYHFTRKEFLLSIFRSRHRHGRCTSDADRSNERTVDSVPKDCKRSDEPSVSYVWTV